MKFMKWCAGSHLFLNGPNVHTYLKEMNQEVLSKSDTVTVGEASGTIPKKVHGYIAASNQELNMISTFKQLGQFFGEKWILKALSLLNLEGKP